MQNYDQTVDHFISLDLLGDHDPEKQQITLYDVPNRADIIAGITEYLIKNVHTFQIYTKYIDDQFVNIVISDINI